ncbi:hypothetical protein BP5796_10833 [Coleophoma crateriformis]|uniref:Calcium-dependent phosphotriesterase n=1 Tax=Coleophoma crateriformis TaxID=565419 RepID=A0A3D8QLE6_9HELO|nr:hypothetical protein BP5796_10833 [Coleophoma crateriformis]
MQRRLPTVAIVSVALIAVIYQCVFKSLLFDSLGYGRRTTNISAFNVKCQKLQDPGLEACEDMWLHEPSGLLYLACSDSQHRPSWVPSLVQFNVSGRPMSDHVAVLDTRSDKPLKSRLQWLRVENFSGNNGDGTLNLHGIDIREDTTSGRLQLLAINHRPPLDPTTGAALDPNSIGANSTIELFEIEMDSGKPTMKHIKTYADKIIDTPNRVAWVGEDAFVFSNDASAKTGIRRGFDVFLGCGSVGYCNDHGCHKAYETGFSFPNGLVHGRDGLIYVPSSVTGEVQVFSITPKQHLEKMNSFQVPYPIDNLSVDRNGDIYAATFPNLHKMLKSAEDPFKINPASAVFRIRKVTETSEADIKREGGYLVEKIMEDDGSVLPGSTTALHDVEGRRIFLGGTFSPFVTVCELG